MQELVELYLQTVLLHSEPASRAGRQLLRGGRSDATRCVARSDWVELYLRVCKALQSACEWDEAQARELIEKDRARAQRRSRALGQHDAIPEESEFMVPEAFVDSLSELTDVWSVGTDAGEYRDFLKCLFLRITQRI